jgi:hypothetical protein
MSQDTQVLEGKTTSLAYDLIRDPNKYPIHAYLSVTFNRDAYVGTTSRKIPVSLVQQLRTEQVTLEGTLEGVEPSQEDVVIELHDGDYVYKINSAGINQILSNGEVKYQRE